MTEYGCNDCGEERIPRRVAGKLTCPECGSENIVCMDPTKDCVQGPPICLQGTNLDSVRIEELGATRALTIPLSLILDTDTALREVREIGDALIVYKVRAIPGPYPDDQMWMAECGGSFYGKGATPMQAIAAMKQMEANP